MPILPLASAFGMKNVSMRNMIAHRFIHVEDSPDDAELVRLNLGPYRNAEVVWVDTEAGYIAQLDRQVPDAIICDYDLPRFSAERALEVLRERGLELPFIVVSNHIGESAAVVAMQQGASDYLSKSDLSRLPKAIESAIDRAAARRERAAAEAALRESEALKKGILESVATRIAVLDGEGGIIAVNRAWEEFEAIRARSGMAGRMVGNNYLRMLKQAADEGHALAPQIHEGLCDVIQRVRPVFSMELEYSVGGASRWTALRVSPLVGSRDGVVVSQDDITERMLAHLALGEAHRRMQALSKRVLMVQEEERRNVSRELHDELGQTLAALKIGLDRLRTAAPAEAESLHGECRQIVDTTLERVRRMSQDLRPPQLDQLGLEDALAWLAQRQQNTTGLSVECSAQDLPSRLPSTIAIACYRIAQEAINNASKHSGAAAVRVSLRCHGNLLHLIVRDDGTGFDQEVARRSAERGTNIGLVSMAERAELAGGQLKVKSAPGEGTVIKAVFPLTEYHPQLHTQDAPAEEA